jgi:hypothetical protein
MELLGVNRKQLDSLRREKGFPTAYVSQRVRIYISDDVLLWVKGLPNSVTVRRKPSSD